jgi:glycosyltransferase involved in cell wall biosynthesis
MKILQVCHSFPPDASGVGEVVWQLSRHLVRRGHVVHVATGVHPDAPMMDRMEGIHVHRFDISGNTLIGIRGDCDDYMKLLRSDDWDVIVFHNLQNWPVELALPIIPSLRVPTVVVSHGTFHLKAVLPCRGALLGERHKRAADYRSTLKTAMRSVSAFVVLSPALVDDPILADLGIENPKVIRNGVELPLFPHPTGVRSRLGLTDQPWVAAVSRHSRVKNHRAFFAVAKELRKEIPKIQTSIIGSPYPAASWNLGRVGVSGGCWYECRLRALRQPYVKLLPSLPRPEVLSAIAASNLVLLTSRHEASPLVLLEAMALSVPWVSIDVGGVRDYSGGIVVDKIADMPKVIVDLIKDPERMAHLGSCGRKAAETVHNWSVIASHHEALYTSLSMEIAGKCLQSQ